MEFAGISLSDSFYSANDTYPVASGLCNNT